MKTFTEHQILLISKLSDKFGFKIHLIQPNAVAGTIDKMNLPIDYLQKELKVAKVKLSVNLKDMCICLYA